MSSQIRCALTVSSLVTAMWMSSCTTIAPNSAPAESHLADADGGLSPAASIDHSDTIWWSDGDEIFEDQYEVINGRVIIQGDMSLGTEDEAWQQHRELIERYPNGMPRDKALVESRSRRIWDDGIIRYQISRSWNADQTNAINQAIRAWNLQSAQTGLTWVRAPLAPRTAGVLFDREANGQCTSATGQHQRRRDINLDPSCVQPYGQNQNTIEHEMGHAMGLHHEHSRSDRETWIHYIESNYNYKSGDTRIWDHLPRRFENIGNFDVQSLMQYNSINSFSYINAASQPMPYFVDRSELTLFTALGSGGAVSATHRYNRMIRLDRVGIEMANVRTTDVDADGFDDLLTTSGGEPVWSSRGATGWIPLRPGGLRVVGAIGELAIGRFDAHVGVDVVRIHGTTWTLFSSDGTSTSTSRSMTTSHFECRDTNADGLDDVFSVQSDGTWSSAFGGSVLAPQTPRSNVDMGVRDFRLVALAGSGHELRVVAFRSGVLSHASLDGGAWSSVFGTAGRGPLPAHATTLDKVYFVEIEGIRRDPNEPVDILTYSDGRDGRGRRAGEAVFVADALGSTAGNTSLVSNITDDFAPEMRIHPAIGYFSSPDQASILSYGIIFRAQGPSQSDISALGIMNLSSGPTTLTDRYPLAALPAPIPIGANRLSDTFVAGVAPTERIELEATFMSPSGVRAVQVQTRRRGAAGAMTVIADRTQNGSADTMTVRETFSQVAPGLYEVRAIPISPAPVWASRNTAVWWFYVSGDTCGDGFQDQSEFCDNGPANSDTTPDACRTSCYLAACADGVVDFGEQCDNGIWQNNDYIPNACRTNCVFAYCGDSVLDSGEACDSGSLNSFAPNATCRPTCEFLRCGDSIVDNFFGENCDTGASRSDSVPNACRTNCQSAHCGDGVVDTGETCDDGNSNDADGCRNNCTSCGDGIVGVGETCDDGNLVDTDACRNNCTRCGDGIQDSVEQCDNGTSNGICTGVGCTTTCLVCIE